MCSDLANASKLIGNIIWDHIAKVANTVLKGKDVDYA